MKIPGHLAVGLYFRERMGITGRYSLWLLAGALLPDLIDKPLMYMGVTPFGRSIGHAPSMWLLVWLCWALWVRVRNRSSFHVGVICVLVGAASHLLADLSNDALNGWLFTGFALDGWVGWPWWDADDLYLRVPAWRTDLRGLWTPLELGVVIWGVWRALKIGRRHLR